ncbi:MAG: hypothetical protein P1V19_01190 [Gimesia sp.]|nr:hypothetical protein [Gimesia sp.]
MDVTRRPDSFYQHFLVKMITSQRFLFCPLSATLRSPLAEGRSPRLYRVIAGTGTVKEQD